MYLLDTNALIILMYGEVTEARLSGDAMNKMLDSEELYLSIVSLWELAIKKKIGKLNINNSIHDIAVKCDEENIKIIPIKIEHMDKTLELPLNANHKDPFDRLILSTALSEEMVLISTDAKMQNYGVDVMS